MHYDKVKTIAYITEPYVVVRAGRDCWDSYDKMEITKDTKWGDIPEVDLKFLGRLLKFRHHSVLEHCIIKGYMRDITKTQPFRENPYSKTSGATITTNLRVVIEEPSIRTMFKGTAVENILDILESGKDSNTVQTPIPKSTSTSDCRNCTMATKDGLHNNINVSILQQLNNNRAYLIDMFETSYITLDIKGISRFMLQELARHRAFSLSVKSTRYTIKKDLKTEADFKGLDDKVRASKYVWLTNDDYLDAIIIESLQKLKIASGKYSNDDIKGILPESYKTDLVLTTNLMGLFNFLRLRLDKAALPAIQQLAQSIYDTLDDNTKKLYNKYIYWFNNVKYLLL